MKSPPPVFPARTHTSADQWDSKSAKRIYHTFTLDFENITDHAVYSAPLKLLRRVYESWVQNGRGQGRFEAFEHGLNMIAYDYHGTLTPADLEWIKEQRKKVLSLVDNQSTRAARKKRKLETQTRVQELFIKEIEYSDAD